MSTAESDDETFDALLEDAEASLDRLEETLGESDALDDLDDDTIETVVGDVDNLVRVTEEILELLEAMDLSDLPDAIDGDELLDAIDIGEIPDVLANEDEGVTELVDFTELFEAIDLLNAWNATDLTEVWQEKNELDDALTDLEDGDVAGMVEDAVSDVTDDGGDGLLGDDEDGVLDTGMDAATATKETLGDIDVAEDPEAYQIAIQQQAMRGIDAFRTALLETHETFERLYEFNREKMRRQDKSTNSRNPTASSTMPMDRLDLGGGARYSTVPQEVKLSTAPTRKRIYGRRFEIERERQRRTNDD
ncbi:hypothetical protein [Natrinema halophilum]|uniref:Uncharacterized protein n=1 Tax=Natrinema halophilum TaxID=1699371 RepID=A0A7D5KWV2_9EURY|nr:hypothetical protein [Natrinema halophilum]QLG48082.1 hypothetical protein HYG82_04085 [Natrinema halophilum]